MPIFFIISTLEFYFIKWIAVINKFVCDIQCGIELEKKKKLTP